MDTPFLQLYLRPVTEIQSYLNIFYLMLAFPLGLAYFIFLVVGFSLGIGLLIIWVGLFILAFVAAFAWALALFERQLTMTLLHIEIPVADAPITNSPRIWERVRAYLIRPRTWKSLVYLFLKFPLGIFSFVASVVALALSVGLILAPFTYEHSDINFGFLQIDTVEKAVFACFIGLFIFPGALHVLNFIADLSAQIARALLSE